MLLLGPTRLLTFRDFFSNVDFFSILKCFIHEESPLNWETKSKIGHMEVRISSLFLYKRITSKNFSVHTRLFAPTRLLNFHQFSSIHVYLPLHVYSGQESRYNNIRYVI